MDLTKESLYGCKEFTENDIQQLCQDFADYIRWKDNPTQEHIQNYFDSNCKKLNNDNSDKNLGHFDTNIQFMYVFSSVNYIMII